MLSGFLFLTSLILVLAFVSLYLLDRTSRIAAIHGNINQLEVLTLNLIKNDNDFFDLETINQEYFRTHHSMFFVKRDSLLSLINAGIKDVILKSKNKSYAVDGNLAKIDSTLKVYNQKFDELEKLLYRKGFRDYGLEGEMRTHAHKLEERSYDIEISKILFLRRNEKDFFLRHDVVYIQNFNTLADNLIVELQKHGDKNAVAIYHAKEYKRLFNELVDIQIKIGMSSMDGLRHSLNKLTSSLSNQYYLLAEYSSWFSSNAQKSAGIFFVVMLVGAIVFSLLSGYWISKRLSAPIARLSKLMNNVMTEKTNGKIDFSLNNAAEEINTLTGSFIQLMDQTTQQMKEIEAKSKLLKKRNKELKKLNRELDSFLYSTAHDLRSPLSSLLGLISIAKYDNKQPELTAYFEMMENSINRLEHFIAQIVSYSKNKRLELIVEKLDLATIISEIFENHYFVEGAMRIDKQVDIRETAPFYSDAGRITILLNNLISNAIRYADLKKEQPFIRISVKTDQDEAVIEFVDNGIGIGAQHLDKIFDMFYRANIHSKGSGLGLFIFKETITKLKGFVSVESAEGAGTKFFIRIPNLYQENAKQQLPLAMVSLQQ